MSFDITSVLLGVSDSDTRGGTQVTYLPVDKIDPDPDNFYSLAGIDELADSIALIGLQQPLLVRNGEEPGRYTVISGHRRLAAIQLLQDGEDDSAHMFDRGVPCIVDLGSLGIIPGSELAKALQELKLIYANSATRVLNAAEISKQAERIEALLYTMKNQGMTFPGRMRQHVAKICQVSQTKIARLHAIRENLQPELLERFDQGELNESVAYRISQESNAVQSKLATAAGPSIKIYDVPTVEAALRQLKAPTKTAPAEADTYTAEAYLEERAREDDAFFEMLSEEADEFLKILGAVNDRQEGIQRLKDAYGRTHCDWFYGRVNVDCSPKGVRLWDTVGHSGNDISRTWTDVYDMLCAIALNRAALQLEKPRKNNPSPSASGSLQWQTGTPTERGTYETRVGVGEEDSIKAGSWQRLEWNGEDWQFANGAELPKGVKVFRWVKLPEV